MHVDAVVAAGAELTFAGAVYAVRDAEDGVERADQSMCAAAELGRVSSPVLCRGVRDVRVRCCVRWEQRFVSCRASSRVQRVPRSHAVLWEEITIRCRVNRLSGIGATSSAP